MARTTAAAFEKVAKSEGRRFDYAVGLEIEPRPHAPVEPEIRRVFAGVNGAYLGRIARRVRKSYGHREADLEEAICAVLLKLFETRRELFREDPRGWEALLCKSVHFWLIRRRLRERSCASLDAMVEAGDEATLSRAELCVSLSSSAAEESRYVAPPLPGEEWSRVQVLGAFQRFRDDHGRPPKASECKRSHGLPSTKTIQRLFGTFNKAVLEGGMVPGEIGRRRRKWTPVEAAWVCRSFYRWKGWWPERSDLMLYPEFLPSPSVAERIFGKLRSGQIRRRAEAILAYAEGTD